MRRSFTCERGERERERGVVTGESRSEGSGNGGRGGREGLSREKVGEAEGREGQEEKVGEGGRGSSI